VAAQTQIGRNLLTPISEERICEVLGYTNTAPSQLTYNHLQLQDATQGSEDLARIRNSPENELSGHIDRSTQSNTAQQIQIEGNGLGSLTPDSSLANQSSHQTIPSASSIAHRSPASEFHPSNHMPQQSMSPKDMNAFGDLNMNYFTDFFPDQTSMNLFPDLDTSLCQ
jgi:hypothetical protein